MSPTVASSDHYAFTISCGAETLTVSYRRRELAFLCGRSSPELTAFRRAVGLWDNFLVADGMDTQAWTDKPGLALHETTSALTSRLERDWHLFGKDYAFRCSRDMHRRSGQQVVVLKDGGTGILVAQRPGELHMETGSRTDMQVIDLRALDLYEAQSPPVIRFYSEPNDIRWRELLKPLLSFVEATACSTYRIRHHFADRTFG